MTEVSTALSNHIQMLEIGIIFAIVTSLIAWKRNFYHFPQIRFLDDAFLQFTEVAGAFLVFLTIAILFAPLVSSALFLLQKGNADLNFIVSDPKIQGWLNVFSIVSTFIGMGCYFALLSPRARQSVGGIASFLGTKQIFRDCLFGMLTWIICYPLVIVVSQISSIIVIWKFAPMHYEQTAVHHLRMITNFTWLFGVMVFLLIVIVPIIEEILFRGFLQNWLKKKLGHRWAISLTAIIFAIFHYSRSQGLGNIELLTSLFLLACFLGYLRERQQSLWAPIGLHSIFNAISIIAIAIEK